MQALRQFGGAIATSLISIALVIGGLSLALSENSPQPFPSPSADVAGPIPSPTIGPPAIAPSETPTELIFFFLPTETISFPVSTQTSTRVPTSTSSSFFPTNTTTVCGRPFGWIQYIVQPNDTLFHIAYTHYTTTQALQQANCLGGIVTIYVGQKLWVPNVATRVASTPGVTVFPDFSTSTPPPTEPLTETSLPFTSSPVPSNTPVPATQTPLPTITLSSP